MEEGVYLVFVDVEECLELVVAVYFFDDVVGFFCEFFVDWVVFFVCGEVVDDLLCAIFFCYDDDDACFFGCL